MGSKRRSSDIISLLVSIYGSKDIFIDEYRAVLADRLLHQLNYNTARSDLLVHFCQTCNQIWTFVTNTQTSCIEGLSKLKQ